MKSLFNSSRPTTIWIASFHLVGGLEKGILANPGFVRGGHRVYPKTRYRTWLEKARFELKSEIENH